MTNADRIRAMSNEELVNLVTIAIKGIAPCALYTHIGANGELLISKKSAMDTALEWLQQPAEEDKQ